MKKQPGQLPDEFIGKDKKVKRTPQVKSRPTQTEDWEVAKNRKKNKKGAARSETLCGQREWELQTNLRRRVTWHATLEAGWSAGSASTLGTGKRSAKHWGSPVPTVLAHKSFRDANILEEEAYQRSGVTTPRCRKNVQGDRGTPEKGRGRTN